jgi:putative hydrolase of the HAD superfamily
MLKAVFFDIDNTLYDSAKLASMARMNSVLAMIDAGLDEPEDQILRDLNSVIKKYGPNYPHHYDELLKMYDRLDPKIIAAGVVAYEHTKIGYLKPLPGVDPVLIELKKSLKLGVISNGLRIKQWEKLVGLRIHHFFLAVITSEECGCEKPSPEIFRAALEALNVKPDEAVMVGDKYDVDIVGAKALGMHTIWLRKGEPKDSNEINSFAQIPEQIKGLK